MANENQGCKTAQGVVWGVVRNVTDKGVRVYGTDIVSGNKGIAKGEAALYRVTFDLAREEVTADGEYRIRLSMGGCEVAVLRPRFLDPADKLRTDGVLQSLQEAARYGRER